MANGLFEDIPEAFQRRRRQQVERLIERTPQATDLGTVGATDDAAARRNLLSRVDREAARRRPKAMRDVGLVDVVGSDGKVRTEILRKGRKARQRKKLAARLAGTQQAQGMSSNLAALRKILEQIRGGA